MKLTYSIGDHVTFEDGWTGEVVNILCKGHGDIRPPYHQEGHPIVAGVNGCVGHIHIIPSDWPIYYGDEIQENMIKSVMPKKVSFEEAMTDVNQYFSALADGTIGMASAETLQLMLENLYDAVEHKFHKQ